MDFLTSNSMLLSQKSIDFLWQKQQVTMDNISNVSTPGYKARYVTFEEEFRSKFDSLTNRKYGGIREDIQNAKAFVRYTNNESTRLDGNNVNVDVESIELARAGLQYQYLVRSITDDITRLRAAIKGQ